MREKQKIPPKKYVLVFCAPRDRPREDDVFVYNTR